MASETTKLQFNFKTPAGSLLNVYADDSDDANLQLQGLVANLPTVTEIEGLLGAVQTVNNAFQPPAQAAQSAPAQAQQAAPQAQASASADGNIARYNTSWGDGPGNPKFMLAPGLPSPKGEPAPICNHGPMQYKEFTKKDGTKDLRGHFCTQKGSNCAGKFLFG